MSGFVEYTRFGAPARAVGHNRSTVQVQPEHQRRPLRRIFAARHRVRRDRVVVRYSRLHRSICGERGIVFIKP